MKVLKKGNKLVRVTPIKAAFLNTLGWKPVNKKPKDKYADEQK